MVIPLCLYINQHQNLLRLFCAKIKENQQAFIYYINVNSNLLYFIYWHINLWTAFLHAQKIWHYENMLKNPLYIRLNKKEIWICYNVDKIIYKLIYIHLYYYFSRMFCTNLLSHQHNSCTTVTQRYNICETCAQKLCWLENVFPTTVVY